MAVMGDLTDFGVAGILHLLDLSRATGQLRIVADGDEAALSFERGRLVAVGSARLPLRLGRVLQQKGIIAPAQLHQALREQEASDHARPLGAILLDRGWITAVELTRCIEEQSIAVLARVMSAPRGTFTYHPGAVAPRAIATVTLDAGRILLDATKRADELGRLRDRFPHRYAPLAATVHVDVTVIPNTPAEERVLTALRAGAGSLAELEELLPVDETSLLRTLIEMRRRGLVVAGEAAPRQELGIAGTPPPNEEDLIALLSERPTPSPARAVATVSGALATVR